MRIGLSPALGDLALPLQRKSLNVPALCFISRRIVCITIKPIHNRLHVPRIVSELRERHLKQEMRREKAQELCIHIFKKPLFARKALELHRNDGRGIRNFRDKPCNFARHQRQSASNVFTACAKARFVVRQRFSKCCCCERAVDDIVFEPTVGELYYGRVVRLMTFGAFVELAPGKDGLVHISKLADKRIEKVEDACKVGDMMWVKFMEIDEKGRWNLSHKDAMKEIAAKEAAGEKIM